MPFYLQMSNKYNSTTRHLRHLYLHIYDSSKYSSKYHVMSFSLSANYICLLQR